MTRLEGQYSLCLSRPRWLIFLINSRLLGISARSLQPASGWSGHALPKGEAMGEVDNKEKAAISRRILLGASAACLMPISARGENAAAGSVEAIMGEGFAQSAAARRL